MKFQAKKRFRKNYQKTKTLNAKVNMAVSKALNSKIERKERRYDFTSVGGTNIGLTSNSLASVSYGSGAPVCSLFAGIAQGPGEGQRNGAAVTANSINIHLALQPGDNTNYIRTILVRPRGQANLTSAANFVSALFNGAASTSTQCGSAIDTNNFKIYLDKTHFITYKPVDGATSTQIPNSVILDFFMRTKSKILYDQTSGYPNKDYFLILISDSAAPPNPGAVHGYVKLTYQDA